MSKSSVHITNEMLLEVLALSKDATAIYSSEDLHIRFANDSMIAIWGKDRGVIGKTFEEAIPEIKGQPFTALLQQVWRTGETYTAKDTPADLVVDGKLQTFYFDFEYRAIRNQAGETYCLLHTAADVTERFYAWKLAKEREDALIQSYEKLKFMNKEYQLINEDLEASNEEITAGIEQLAEANDELRISNEEISSLNSRLTESQTNFKRLVEQAPVAILVFSGEDLVIETANQPMLDILHMDAAVIGRPILESMPELKGEPAVELLFEVYRTGKSSDGGEVPVRMMRNGQTETRYFNFSYRPLRDGGRIIGVMDLAVEVTDQVQSRKNLEAIIAEKTELEKTLRSSEQRLQGILDTMAEGVGITDSTGNMVYANPMAQRILGLSQNQIKERTYYDTRWQNLRIDGSPLPDDEHPMTIMMREKVSIYDQEIAVQPPVGERFYISINAAPIVDDDGKLTGGIGTFMDVTNRRKMIMEKDDFISVASHELKTPVTTLKATLQLLARLQDNIRPDMLKTLIGQANKSLNKLNGLIAELLDTNRISQGQLHVHKTIFTVSDLVNDCCQHIRMAGGHEVILKGNPDLEIYADEQQIDQVLVNFVNNAVKYAPDSREIIIEVTRLTDKVKISVTDHGPGISPEKKPHLFDRYYRADYNGIQFSGLGLGLYICAEIIKKHDGEIGADSEPGKGSTFWFTLPVED